MIDFLFESHVRVRSAIRLHQSPIVSLLLFSSFIRNEMAAPPTFYYTFSSSNWKEIIYVSINVKIVVVE